MPIGLAREQREQVVARAEHGPQRSARGQRTAEAIGLLPAANRVRSGGATHGVDQLETPSPLPALAFDRRATKVSRAITARR